MMTQAQGVEVPSKVVWTVALFLAAWTLGGLYYAGRLVAQVERAVDELAAVKVVQADHNERITRNREDLLTLHASRAKPRARTWK